jgi:hypothetical protein
MPVQGKKTQKLEEEKDEKNPQHEKELPPRSVKNFRSMKILSQ